MVVTPAGSALTTHLPKAKAQAEASSGELGVHRACTQPLSSIPGMGVPRGTAPNRQINPVHSAIEAPQGEKAQTFCLQESHHPSKTHFPLKIVPHLRSPATQAHHQQTSTYSQIFLIERVENSQKELHEASSVGKQRPSETISGATTHGNAA